MQNAVLFVNIRKENADHVSKEICAELEKRGSNVTALSVDGVPGALPQKKFDIAFSLGGDGTVLCAARTLASCGVPILPVHLGSLGFLAGVEKNQWLSVYEQWLDGAARISVRCMLECSVERDGRNVYRNICLNDTVISSLGKAKLISLRLQTEAAQGQFADLGSYRSDGVIIATPTGSTAYSMAAGGPIIDPEMEAQIVSPICSFALSNRPIVLPSRQNLYVSVEKNQRSGVLLTVDGQDTFELKAEDTIVIRHSPHYTRLISSDRSAYYCALQKKLGWGHGGAGGPHA